MIKFISLFLFAIILILFGFYQWEYAKRPVLKFPYPYKLDYAPEITIERNDPKRNIDILIIGDRLASDLYARSETMNEVLSKGLKKPLNLGLLKSDKIGTHRILHKLKALKERPKVIIFYGNAYASSEYKFKTSEIPTIKENIALYEKPEVASILMFFPWFSKFIYKPFTQVALSNKVQKKISSLDDEKIIKRQEVEYVIYKQEIKELLKKIKAMNSLGIVVSTPINYDIPPKKICQGSNSADVKKEVSKIQRIINQGDLKQATLLTDDLKASAPGNAMAYFLSGQIHKKFNNNERAIIGLRFATALDCKKWRHDAVLNSIIEKTTKEQGMIFYDFESVLLKEWGNNVTFLDEIRPQDYYYQKGVKILARQLRAILGL